MKNSIHSLPTHLILIAYLTGFVSVSFPENVEIKPGGTIPKLESFDAMGMPYSLHPPEGRIIAILFWDVNEESSIDAMQEAVILYKRFHEKGLEALGICTSESENAVVNFCERWMVPFPVAMNAEEDPEIAEQMNVSQIPCMILVGQGGEILAVNLEKDALHAKVAEILNVSLDDLPMPSELTARESNRDRMEMSGIPGINEGVLFEAVDYQVSVDAFGSKAERKEAEDCKKNLRKISLAFQRYRMDHNGEMPTRLSDLFPKYLHDEQILLDPKNPTAQTYIPDLGDPRIPCSFLYEFTNAPANGRDNYQAWKKEQLQEYGDRVPVLRCFNYERSLNLSYGGEIYFSDSTWEMNNKQGRTPDDPDAKVRRQLLKIAVALDDYKNDHGEVPNELTDLLPKYLQDETVFAIPQTGQPFSYQFSVSGGQRKIKISQLEEFGDYVPIVRARGILENGRVINLSYGGEIWESDSAWEDNLQEDSGPTATRQRMTLAKQVRQGDESVALAELDWPNEPLAGIDKIEEKEQLLPLKGLWAIQNGSIRQLLPDSQQSALLFRPFLKKGEIRFKATVENGEEGVRVLFGFTAPKRYFIWNIGGWGNNVSVVEKRTSIHDNEYKFISEKKQFTFKHEEQHEIRLVIDSVAKTAWGFVNGEEIMTLQAQEPLEGRVGLSTWNTMARFEGIEIEGLE